MAAGRAVPNAFRDRSLNGSVTPMVGAGRDRPVRVVPVVRVVPGRVDPEMPGPAPVLPVTEPPGMVADGMGPPGMAAGSRFAVRPVAPGMRFARAVGANADPLSGAAAMASAPTEIAPPAVMLPAIGCTEPAAALIGPSSAIGPDWSVALQTLALRCAGPLSAVRLSAVPLTGAPSIAVLAAVQLAVPPAVLLVALAPRVLGLAGPMGPGLIDACLMRPALTVAEIA